MPVPIKSGRPIKQDELQAILTQRLVLDTLKRDLEKAKEELDRMELPLIARVKAGAPQQHGDLAATVEVREGQRRPKWKEVYASVAGPEAVERVIRETPPGQAEDKLIVSVAGKVAKTA